MGVLVVEGASYLCTMGTGQGSLQVTSQKAVKVEGKMVATIKDAEPLTNILPCGMCTSMENPQVSAATAAALGVLTPQPCIPSISGVWVLTQSKVLAGGAPCLSNDSQVPCTYAGVLSITNPGQMKVIL